ncbi:hypothetical protein X766_33240 [Mesorhizobium sp. LSJC255A00]|nr:hypothetical protein X766_33240 [Mesorhizobium sp. LSJC255A00]
MRRDPASGAVVIMLRSLKMQGIARRRSPNSPSRDPAFRAAVPILSIWPGFDFASSEVNDALVRQLRAGAACRQLRSRGLRAAHRLRH